MNWKSSSPAEGGRFLRRDDGVERVARLRAVLARVAVSNGRDVLEAEGHEGVADVQLEVAVMGGHVEHEPVNLQRLEPLFARPVLVRDGQDLFESFGHGNEM